MHAKQGAHVALCCDQNAWVSVKLLLRVSCYESMCHMHTLFFYYTDKLYKMYFSGWTTFKSWPPIILNYTTFILEAGSLTMWVSKTRGPCSLRLDNWCTIHKHGKGTYIWLYSFLVATYVDEKWFTSHNPVRYKGVVKQQTFGASYHFPMTMKTSFLCHCYPRSSMSSRASITLGLLAQGPRQS